MTFVCPSRRNILWRIAVFLEAKKTMFNKEKLEESHDELVCFSYVIVFNKTCFSEKLYSRYIDAYICRLMRSNDVP